MLASRAVRWKFEFSVVRRRRPDAAGRHRAALGCGFEGWLEPVTAEAKVDCLPFRRNEGTTAVRKLRSLPTARRTGQVGPKGTSVAIVDTTCALTGDSWTRAGPTGVQSRTPSWANERHVIAVPDREGVDCTLET